MTKKPLAALSLEDRRYILLNCVWDEFIAYLQFFLLTTDLSKLSTKFINDKKPEHHISSDLPSVAIAAAEESADLLKKQVNAEYETDIAKFTSSS